MVSFRLGSSAGLASVPLLSFFAIKDFSRWEADNDPSRNSLRLLPSGPDRIGEKLVRANLPKGLYQSLTGNSQAASSAVADIRNKGHKTAHTIFTTTAE